MSGGSVRSESPKTEEAAASEEVAQLRIRVAQLEARIAHLERSPVRRLTRRVGVLWLRFLRLTLTRWM